MARNLSRNTELFISTIPPASFNDTNCIGNAAADGDNTCWKVNVLDGFSFSQDVATQEIGVSESSSECTGQGQLARGTLGFNTALNPVDVSFSTYVRPYNAAGFGEPRCVELPLWCGAIGTEASMNLSPDTPTNLASFEQDIVSDPESITFTTAQSDVNELMPLYLYFKLENTCYVVSEFQVGTAEVDFSIDGIATINWSGNGTVVQEDEAAYNMIDATLTADTDYVDVPTTVAASFLRNKLSTLELTDVEDYGTPDDADTFASVSGPIITLGTTITADVYANGRVYNVDSDEWATILSNNAGDVTVSAADEDKVNVTANWNSADVLNFFLDTQHSAVTYCIPITGGTLTLENNVTYLTPEELAIVNQPLAGFTGNRAITGSVTAYLNTGAQGSGGLLQDLLAKITEVSNNYAVTLHMGGSSTDTTRVDFIIPHAQVTIPTTNVEDVISTEISFTAKSWTSGKQSFESANEMTIGYFTPGS